MDMKSLIRILTEATKYDNMFQRFFDIVKNAEPEVSWKGEATYEVADEIEWARRVLKKEDRIVWYLRWYRLAVVEELTKHYPAHKDLNNLYKKYLNELGVQRSPIAKAQLSQIKSKLTHYMGIPSAKIQDHVFRKETPEELLDILNNFETEWTEQIGDDGKVVEEEPNHTLVLKFPDGSAWWNLDKSACDKEAEAMGHCGNRYGNSTDTILSFRKPVDTPEGTKWVPHLTFILDEDNWLGEMKGRANKKPAEKYHPYIIALLKQDLIKGIKGGGYDPENNFELTDLPEKQQEELLTLKPTLGTPTQVYKHLGNSKETVQVLLKRTEAEGVEIKWNEEMQRFVVLEWESLMKFILLYGDSFSVDFVKGNIDYSEIHVPDRDVAYFFDNLPANVLNDIYDYVEERYNKEDFDSHEELYEFLQDQGDDLANLAASSVIDGVVSGTEDNISKELRKTIDSLLDHFNAEFVYLDIRKRPTTNIDQAVLDYPMYYTYTPKNLALELESINEFDVFIADVESGEGLEFELDEHGNGWEDYDEKYAIDQFVSEYKGFIVANSGMTMESASKSMRKLIESIKL